MPSGEIKDIRIYPNGQGNEWGFLVENGTGQTQMFWRQPGQNLPSLKIGEKVDFDIENYMMGDPSGQGPRRLIQVAILSQS